MFLCDNRTERRSELNRRSFVMSGTSLLAAAATVSAAPGSQEQRDSSLVPQTFVRRIQADGVDIFYREAGAPNAPVILLLHGFPSSSFQYHELIPLLADRYRVIAPDFPAFGFTTVPAERNYTYSFEAITQTMLAFTEALGLTRYALYVFDYGGPIGFRMAVARPERITGIVSQNGDIYFEGLGPSFLPIQRYWADPSLANRDALRGVFTLDAIQQQYTDGAPHPERIAPETYTLDYALIQRPGNIEIQLDLLLDYRTNVALYPVFQQYLRTSKPPLFAIWGRNDLFFVPAGALAFRRDLPDVKVRFLNTGHFAVATNVVQIANAIRLFLSSVYNERNDSDL